MKSEPAIVPQRRRWRKTAIFITALAIVGVTILSLELFPSGRPSRAEARKNSKIVNGAGFSMWGSRKLNEYFSHYSRGPKVKEWGRRFARAYEFSNGNPPNGMTDAEMHLLMAFPEMRKLNLSEAEITDAGLSKIKGLRNLKLLSVRGSHVTDAGLTNISGFTKLEELFIQDSKVQGPGLSDLKNLKKLRVLRLDDLPIRDEHLQYLAGLENLEHLDLGETQVSGEGLKHLAGLKKLRNLSLMSNKALTNEGLRHLIPLLRSRNPGTNGMTLHLGWTRIDDEAIPTLKQFQGLTKLHLESTRITRAGLEDLKMAMPKTKVEHY